MLRTNQTFAEIQVYEGVAERTGVTAARDEVRGSKHVCRSMSDLVNKVRRLGDGHFYIPTEAWPAGETKVVLTTAWTPMG